MNEELQHHLKIKTGDVGRYVLLPGDPGRCEKIASYFDNPQLIAYNREHKTYTGTLLGEKVSVVSTGMGCPSTAIAVEELIKVGADTFIRVGTSGAMQPHIKTGDVAIVSGAIRDEGTTLHYLPVEFPAIADTDVVLAITEGAKKMGIPYHIGISQTKESYYGQHAPETMPVANRLLSRWKAWVAGGAVCSEMEAAIIFVLASIHRKRAGGVMLMKGLPESFPDSEEERQKALSLLTVDRPISVAIESIKTLIEWDRKKGK